MNQLSFIFIFFPIGGVSQRLYEGRKGIENGFIPLSMNLLDTHRIQ